MFESASVMAEGHTGMMARAGEGHTGMLAHEMNRISLKMSALGGERGAPEDADAAGASEAHSQGGPTGASNSKAVLSALRSLQDKIRVLEDERNSLQMCLRQTQEAKEREEQQHRLLQRQLQLQLQESVKALTVRHESEAEAIRSHASKSQGELSSEVTRLQRRVAEAEAEVERLRERCGQVEHDNVTKDEEVRRLRMSVADLEAADVALKRVNQRLEEQVGNDEHARRELLARNTMLEENIKAMREQKRESEQRAERAAKEYDRLQNEHTALRRQEANLQQQLKESSDTLAHKAVSAETTRAAAS
jgi:chromosome segregation ATPase